MTRLPLIRNNDCAYHTTARSNNKDWFYLAIHDLWPIFCESLSIAQNKTDVEIICFVLMNNHYHILLKTPKSNLDKFQWEFAQHFVRKIKKKTKRINHIFGGRYKWSLIENRNHLFQVYKYIYQNPLKAKMTTTIQAYPYSSFEFFVNMNKSLHSSFIFPKIDDPLITEYGISNILKWLDQSLTNIEYESLRKGLRFRKFKEIKDINSRQKIKYKLPFL